MKKKLWFVLMVFCLVSCTKDLTEYMVRADQIEAANKTQAEKNSQLEAENAEVLKAAQRLQASLDSLKKEYDNIKVTTKLLGMAFSAAENPILSEDLICEITSNGTIECWIPTLVESKELIPRFSFHGNEVTINGTVATSGTSKYDFTSPVKVVVKGDDRTLEYTVLVHAFTGLPILRLDTNAGRKIDSKITYVPAHMSLTEDIQTRSPGDVIEADLQVKGRGNSTWMAPKKPYRLKFYEKVSLLGEHKDKDWVLIANYFDKSMIRNDLAFTLGMKSKLDWTPSGHFVEFILNGEYQGTYYLCEKIEVNNHRVAVGDDGFLLEVEARAAADSSNVHFFAPSIDYAIEIKEPEVSYGDENFNFIVNFVAQADSALFSSDFKDPNVGWQKYMDIDSFVDWYLIHEISKNEDSMFHFSTFINLKRGGKLKMGPIWDFDIAFGNVKEDETTAMMTDGFMLEWSKWYTRLLQDPAFQSKLRERFIYFYNKKDELLTYINTDAHYLKHSAQENQNKWGTLYQWTYKQYNIWGSYQNEVQLLKEWFNERLEWMKKAYNI